MELRSDESRRPGEAGVVGEEGQKERASAGQEASTPTKAARPVERKIRTHSIGLLGCGRSATWRAVDEDRLGPGLVLVPLTIQRYTLALVAEYDRVEGKTEDDVEADELR